MSDKTLTCRDCGQSFVFTAGEQAFYQERGFSEPQRCPACRAKKKAERTASDGYENGGYASSGYSTSQRQHGGENGGGHTTAPRRMYAAICSVCGKQTEVPFMPRSDKPVYCRDCFADQRTAAPRGYSNVN